MTLKDLKIGDIFYCLTDKRKTKFIVRGASVFNRGHGSATRICVDTVKLMYVSKSSRVEVKKLGESKFKEKYKLKPVNSL